MISTASTAPQTIRQEGRDGTLTVGLVMLCQVAHFLTFAAIPLLLPLIREDLAISFAQAGALSAAGTLSYALTQVPAGYLSDRLGPRRLIFVGLLGWSALCGSFGFAGSFWPALAILFVAGAFRALLFAPGLALLASWFPPLRRATALSLFILGSTCGTIVLSLAGPWLTRLHGWRGTLVLSAAIGIGVALLFGVLAKENFRRQPQQPVSMADLLDVARFPIMWICSGLQMVRFAVVAGFAYWLPSFLVADRGMSIPEAGLVTAMSAAISAPSTTLGAYFSDRLGNPPLVIAGSLVALAVASVALPAVDSTPLLLLVIAVYSMFQGFYFGPLFLVPMETLGHRLAGTTAGFANLFANIGGFITVYALGAARDYAGSFQWGFTGIGASCVAGLVLTMVLSRMRSRALAAGTAP